MRKASKKNTRERREIKYTLSKITWLAGHVGTCL
jgi:hypothetical protein